jgi:hypothetical protein
MKKSVKIDGVDVYPCMLEIIDRWDVAQREIGVMVAHIDTLQKANDFLLEFLISGGCETDNANKEVLDTLMGLQALKMDLKQFRNINEE